jgi:hypothetical protein
LFGKTDRVFSLLLDEDGALEGGSSREGPACSTLSLILNISDSAGNGPVDQSVDGGDFGGVDLFVGSLGDLEGEVDGFEFSLGEVGELVDSHSVGVLGIGVVLVDGNEVSQEDVLSVCLLALTAVALSELILVLFEGVDVSLAGRGTLQTVEVDRGDSEEHQSGNQALVHEIMIINLSKLTSNYILLSDIEACGTLSLLVNFYGVKFVL